MKFWYQERLKLRGQESDDPLLEIGRELISSPPQLTQTHPHLYAYIGPHRSTRLSLPEIQREYAQSPDIEHWLWRSPWPHWITASELFNAPIHPLSVQRPLTSIIRSREALKDWPTSPRDLAHAPSPQTSIDLKCSLKVIDPSQVIDDTQFIPTHKVHRRPSSPQEISEHRPTPRWSFHPNTHAQRSALSHQQFTFGSLSSALWVDQPKHSTPYPHIPSAYESLTSLAAVIHRTRSPQKLNLTQSRASKWGTLKLSEETTGRLITMRSEERGAFYHFPLQYDLPFEGVICSSGPLCIGIRTSSVKARGALLLNSILCGARSPQFNLDTPPLLPLSALTDPELSEDHSNHMDLIDRGVSFKVDITRRLMTLSTPTGQHAVWGLSAWNDAQHKLCVITPETSITYMWVPHAEEQNTIDVIDTPPTPNTLQEALDLKGDWVRSIEDQPHLIHQLFMVIDAHGGVEPGTILTGIAWRSPVTVAWRVLYGGATPDLEVTSPLSSLTFLGTTWRHEWLGWSTQLCPRERWRGAFTPLLGESVLSSAIKKAAHLAPIGGDAASLEQSREQYRAYTRMRVEERDEWLKTLDPSRWIEASLNGAPEACLLLALSLMMGSSTDHDTQDSRLSQCSWLHLLITAARRGEPISQLKLSTLSLGHIRDERLEVGGSALGRDPSLYVESESAYWRARGLSHGDALSRQQLSADLKAQAPSATQPDQPPSDLE